MNEVKTKSLMPAWLPAFNKRVTNRIQGLWAPYLPPWVVILHVGRVSGKHWRTPVVGFKRDSKLYVNLIYGSDSQWVQNLLAAGEGDVLRRGKKLHMTDIKVARRGDFDGKLPLGARVLSRSTGLLVGTIS